MILLLIIFAAALLVLVATIFLLGFRLGGDQGQSELSRIRMQAAQAERQLHNLTRQAFMTMAEQVEQRRRSK